MNFLPIWAFNVDVLIFSFWKATAMIFFGYTVILFMEAKLQFRVYQIVYFSVL
jgi:hypothetical protein